MTRRNVEWRHGRAPGIAAALDHGARFAEGRRRNRQQMEVETLQPGSRFLLSLTLAPSLMGGGVLAELASEMRDWPAF